MGVVGIVLVTAYLVGTTVLLIYALLVLWPSPTPSRETAATETSAGAKTQADQPATLDTATVVRQRQEPASVTLLGFTFSVWDEQRLLLLVLLAGALGSLVHALRSVYWYVGNRDLVWSWVAMYVMLPFAGATLGLIFYLVVRGGFFSPQSSFEETSPFGFAAFSALIGMFSQQAVLKLQAVAETLLTKPPAGADAKPQRREPGETDDEQT